MRYKLGDICEIVSGSTPKTGVPEYWDGDIKWITAAELSDDSYVININIAEKKQHQSDDDNHRKQ